VMRLPVQNKPQLCVGHKPVGSLQPRHHLRALPDPDFTTPIGIVAVVAGIAAVVVGGGGAIVAGLAHDDLEAALHELEHLAQNPRGPYIRNNKKKSLAKKILGIGKCGVCVIASGSVSGEAIRHRKP